KTGLRKAVSVLNSAITMNMALDGESPYDNANLFGYLTRHMSVLRTTSRRHFEYMISDKHGIHGNAAFYTTDGMRYEIRLGVAQSSSTPLWENPSVFVCTLGLAGSLNAAGTQVCGGCGSFGLNKNSDNTTKPPCLVVVDVNGDKKPNPSNINCKELACSKLWKLSDPDGKKLTDVFTIMITDKEAIPYGMAAQKAMYNSAK
ncbi:MAG: hypothetical protein Q4F80_04075, partial [bacterium]|nr:hypothetical protein [bacterium]